MNDIDFVHVHASSRRSCRLEHAAGEWPLGADLPEGALPVLQEGAGLTGWRRTTRRTLPPIVDSVIPIVEAKRCDLVTSDHALDDLVTLIPTPGHTIDHYAVTLGRGGKDAVFTGDLIHTPLQARYPNWRCAWITTRRRARRRAEVPGDVLRHQHAVLLCAFPVTVARLCEALGQRVQMRLRHRLIPRKCGCLPGTSGRAADRGSPASWRRWRATMPTC